MVDGDCYQFIQKAYFIFLWHMCRQKDNCGTRGILPRKFLLRSGEIEWEVQPSCSLPADGGRDPSLDLPQPFVVLCFLVLWVWCHGIKAAKHLCHGMVEQVMKARETVSWRTILQNLRLSNLFVRSAYTSVS